MAIQTTRWTPDTCATPPCIIEYQWDDTLPAATRVHTPSALIQQCSFHQGNLLAANYTNVLAENQRKNLMIAQAVSIISGLDPSTIAFTYNPSHVLSLPVPGATIANITTLQAFADTTFGVGTVVVTAVAAITPT